MALLQKHRQVRLVILLVVSSSLVWGCIAFRGNELEPVESPPVVDGEGVKPSVSITWERRYAFRGKEEERLGNPGGELVEIDQVELLEVLRESSYFSTVFGANDYLTPEEHESIDLAMSVELVRLDSEAAEVAGYVIARLTAFVIPFWTTRSYRVDSRVERAGGEVYEYQVEDSVTEVYWIPLGVVAPFFTSFPQLASDVRKNIYRTLLVRMEQDGLLAAAVPGLEAGEMSSRSPD